MVISQSVDASYNITNITTSGKRNFTYYDGYRGIGNKYLLIRIPHALGLYTIFNIWNLVSVILLRCRCTRRLH